MIVQEMKSLKYLASNRLSNRHNERENSMVEHATDSGANKFQKLSASAPGDGLRSTTGLGFSWRRLGRRETNVNRYDFIAVLWTSDIEI
jgi:hypothetical protein